MNEVIVLVCPNNLGTRNSYLKLICPFQKRNTGQNTFSFFGPSIWNKTPKVLKNPTALILSNITSKDNTKLNLNKRKLNQDIIIKTIISIISLSICCYYHNYQLSSVLLISYNENTEFFCVIPCISLFAIYVFVIMDNNFKLMQGFFRQNLIVHAKRNG